tara:strand:- start:932 stop:1495 length:564 start_codon:yes stop_codon:yes gene_type:complete
MNISEFIYAEKVGIIIEHDKEYSGKRYVHFKKKLKLKAIDGKETLLKEKNSIGYFLVINSKVIKIGQTSGEGGLYSCMGFYGCAGQDDPGKTRFAVNLLMREEMKKGNMVEVWMQYEPPFAKKFKGATGVVTKEVLMSAKYIEDDCIKHYYNTTGEYPEWNFQEDGKEMPNWITEEYTNYNAKRKGK